MCWFADPPVNVELVKMRTIFELTGGRDSREPRNMESMVRSSILVLSFLSYSKKMPQVQLCDYRSAAFEFQYVSAPKTETQKLA